MKTVYSDGHRLQNGRAELTDGRLVPCFEKPERADLVRPVLSRVEQFLAAAPVPDQARCG